MRIGDLARRLGTDPPTIRYYEQAGILPAPARRPSGYREYGEKDAARVAAVLALRRLDVPLEEIRELAGTCFDHRCATNTARLVGLVERRSHEVRRRIEELHRLAEQLAELRRRLADDGRTNMIELAQVSATQVEGQTTGCACGCGGSGCTCGCGCCFAPAEGHAQHLDAVQILAQAPTTACECGCSA